MIVSRNEIVSTVYKAFTGMHREVGEADLVATMVAELIRSKAAFVTNGSI